MSIRTDVKVIILGTLLALCSSGPFYVMPDYLAALQVRHGFSLAQLGYVSGTENFMIAISCTATGCAISRLGHRTMLVAALVCVAGNLLTIAPAGYPVILAVRALTGLLGEGPLYAMSYAVLGSAANPDRAFGVGVGSVAIWAALVLYVESMLGRLFGPAAVLVPYAAIAFVLALMTAFARPVPRVDTSSDEVTVSVYVRVGAMALSIILWSAAAGAFWTFTGAAAGVLGVEDQTVTRALSIALIVGLGGIFVPVIMGDRFGRTLPLLVVTAGLALSCYLFFSGRSLVQLAISLSLLQVCWDVAAVYQLAGIATIDRSGRYSAFGAVAQIAGIALGPALSGVALGQFGYGIMPFTVTGIGAVAFLLFFVAVRVPKAKLSAWPVPSQ